MNIETANRLYELRKKNNLSQEELADKLGISRQAVSKWERAEASPDTDNLILLAKLYGVTLDDLLNSDSAADAIEEEKEATAEDVEAEGISINDKGVRITDDEGQTLVINDDGIKCYDKDGKEVDKSKHDPIGAAIGGITAIGALIAYLILGFTVPVGWTCYWVLFLLVPIVGSICECVRKKRFTSFAYPVLIVAVYCFLGLRFGDLTYEIFGTQFTGFWHPFWFLFITVPVYYIIFNLIDKYVLKTKPIDDNDEE